MLWLDTSWVLDLTYIFRPHISLFIVIFSTLTSFHHYFSTSHITTYYIHLLSFSPSLPTRHYPYSTLSGGLSHITTWRAVTSFPRFTSWVVVQISYFRRLSCQRWFILWNQGLVNLSFDDNKTRFRTNDYISSVIRQDNFQSGNHKDKSSQREIMKKKKTSKRSVFQDPIFLRSLCKVVGP